MREYFVLQQHRFERAMAEIGLRPVAAYIVLMVSFVFLSMVIFYKTEFANYIFVLLPLYLMAKLSEEKRIEFLSTIFRNDRYKKLRIIENLAVTFPFLIVLIFRGFYIHSIGLIILAFLLAWTSYKIRSNFSFPTPFSKHPFEFPIGFRKFFYLFLCAYLLVGIAVSVDNYNLGIFSLLSVFIIILSFYSFAEDEFYIWINHTKPATFLSQKLKIAFGFTLILCAPIILVLGIFYYQNFHFTLLSILLGLAFLLFTVVSKYAFYPSETNLQQGLIFAFSLFFPPLLLIAIPYYYLQAVKNLNKYLA